MEHLDFVLSVLEDYCHLQDSGMVAPANRYAVSDVRELIDEMQNAQVQHKCHDSEVAKLKDDLAVMEAEAEHLKKALIDDAKSKVMLEKLALENGQLDISLSGNIFHFFCQSFVNTFKESAATNYLVAEFHGDELGPFTVTMQRSDGLTVYQKLSATECERDQLALRIRHVCDAASHVLKSREMDGIKTSGSADKYNALQEALDEAQAENFDLIEAKIRISELENLAVDLAENYFLHKESHDGISERIKQLNKHIPRKEDGGE